MPYCSNCGAVLESEAKFCTQCGHATLTKSSPTRETKYAGKLVKCPNCGENVPSFQSNCPLCGHEIRETESSGFVKEFAKKLEEIEDSRDAADIRLYRKTQRVISKTDEKKVMLIRNFPIPNTKEDLFEFIILAASNISRDRYSGELSDAQEAISDAWQAKLDQAYKKARISFSDVSGFHEIEKIYSEAAQTSDNEKKKSAKSNVLTTIGIICGVLAFVTAFGFLMHYERKSISEENAHLEAIANEVIVCIEDHNFTRARSKAATLAFSGNDEKSRVKWDTVREEMLNQIDRAEQEYLAANNASSGYSMDEESLITQESTG